MASAPASPAGAGAGADGSSPGTGLVTAPAESALSSVIGVTRAPSTGDNVVAPSPLVGSGSPCGGAPGASSRAPPPPAPPAARAANGGPPHTRLLARRAAPS